MLPILASRTFYADGSSETVIGTAPPTRRTDVEGIVYFHAPPYRTLDYGHPSDRPLVWLGEPTVQLMPGDWLADNAWDALQREMESCPWP